MEKAILGTVVVTGGAGFIGSHTAELLASKAQKVIIYDPWIKNDYLAELKRNSKIEIVEGDLLDRPKLAKVLGAATHVVHLGGILLSEAQADPEKALKTNIAGTINLFELCCSYGIKKVVYASSVTVYGPNPEGSEGAPFDCNSLYGVTKVAGEQLCRYYYHTRDLQYLALRYSSVYGPRQHSYGLYPGLILKAAHSILKGETPVIPGPGNDQQDFIFVKDVARANLLALLSATTGKSLNIVSGTSSSLNDCLNILFDLCQVKNREVIYLPQEGRHLFGNRSFNGGKAKQEIGFIAETSLRNGLKVLLDWITENTR